MKLFPLALAIGLAVAAVVPATAPAEADRLVVAVGGNHHPRYYGHRGYYGRGRYGRGYYGRGLGYHRGFRGPCGRHYYHHYRC